MWVVDQDNPRVEAPQLKKTRRQGYLDSCFKDWPDVIHAQGWDQWEKNGEALTKKWDRKGL